MFRSYCLTRKILNGLRRCQVQKRTFLSEGYACEQQWAKRLDFETLRTVNPSNMSSAIENEYKKSKVISAVDVDVYANLVTEEFQAESLVTYLRDLRLSKEALNVLDSTHQAVIMYLLSLNLTEELLIILYDRLTYGIFPNHYNYNYLMDLFVLKNQYANAAKIAALAMLQDDEGNAITKSLALYSCHKYLEKPEEWIIEQEEEEDKEEVKIRVDFIRNPYYDDHFDITDPLLLVGKTLAFYGKVVGGGIGRSSQLRGLILYKKYKKALDLLLDWKKNIDKDILYADAKQLILQHIESIPDDQRDDDLKKLEKEIKTLSDSSLIKSSLINDIEENVKKAVGECTQSDIEAQEQAFQSWEQDRKDELQKQSKRLRDLKRLMNVEKMKKELQEEEELLTFFKNEEQIELRIEEKETRYKKKYERVAQKHHNIKKVKKMLEANEIDKPLE